MARARKTEPTLAEVVSKLAAVQVDAAERMGRIEEALTALTERPPKTPVSANVQSAKVVAEVAEPKGFPDFDITQVAGVERLSGDKARRKLESWGKSGNIQRLREYAGMSACTHKPTARRPEPHGQAAFAANAEVAKTIVGLLEAGSAPKIRRRGRPRKS